MGILDVLPPKYLQAIWLDIPSNAHGHYSLFELRPTRRLGIGGLTRKKAPEPAMVGGFCNSSRLS